MQISVLGDVWAFLDGVKRTGTPIPRSVLVKKVQRNVNLLATLCKILKSAVKLASADGVRANSVVTHGATKVLSFFTACLVELAQEMPLHDEHMRQIYPVLIDGLRSTAKSFQSSQSSKSGSSIISLQWLKSSCMIIAQVSRRTKFAKPLIKSLLGVISRAFVHTATNAKITNDSGGLEIVMTLAVMAQSQPVTFDGSTIHALVFDVSEEDVSSSLEEQSVLSVQSSYFLEILRTVHTTLDATDLFTSFITGVLRSMTEALAENGAGAISPSKASLLLCFMVSSGLIRQDGLRLMIDTILSAAVVNTATSEGAKCFVVRKIAQRYPNLFDGCVDKLLKETKTGAAAKSMRNFLSAAFVDAPYHIPFRDGTGLLLALRDSSSQVRLHALQNFAASIPLHRLQTTPTRDVVGLAEAALHCLTDSDAEVARLAWTQPVLTRIAEYVEPGLLFEAVAGSFDFWVNISMQDLKQGCEMLCNMFEGLCCASVMAALSLAEASSTLDGKLSGRQWIVYTVIRHAFGLVATIAPANQSHEEFCARVEVAAIACASKAGAVSPLFQHVPEQTTEPLLALAKSIVQHLRQQHVATAHGLEVLSHLVNEAHDSLKPGQSVLSKRSTQALIRLLCMVAVNLAEEQESGGLLCDVMRLVCPLLLQIIYTAGGSSDECRASVKFAADNFSLLFAQVKTTKGVAVDAMRGVRSNVKDLIKMLQAHRADLSDFRVTTLCGLLSYSDAAVAPLVGQCLAAFFLDHPLFVLLGIAFGHVWNDGSAHPRAKSGALYAMTAFVGVTGPPAGIDTKDYSSVLLLLALLMTTACSDTEQHVRCSGIAVARKVANLDSKYMLTLDAQGTALFQPALSKCDLSMLGNMILSSSSTIAMDQSVASAVMGSQIFAKIGAEKLEALQSVLLATLSITAWDLPSSAPILDSVSALPVDLSIKYTLELFKSASSARVDSTGAIFISKALLSSINSIKAATPSTQKEVCSLMCTLIASEGDNYAEAALREEIFNSLARGWAESIANIADKTNLFEASMREQLRAPGRQNVLESIKRIPVNVSTCVLLLHDISENLASASSDLGEHFSEHMHIDGDVPISGLSVQLQQLCSFLEAISPVLRAATVDSANQLSSIVSILMDTFERTNHARLRSILSVEYANSLIMDLAFSCISIAGPAVLKEGQQRSEKSATAFKKYEKARVANDVAIVIKCLGMARTSQVQTSALHLIQVLASLDASAINACINNLGELLSSSVGLYQGQDGLGKEELSKRILRMLVSTMSSSAVGNEVILAQDILQPLCLNLRGMQSHRTSSLLKMALSVMGDSSLPVCVCILLTHAFCSYQLDDRETTQAVNGQGGETFILLSRAAQRKAFRSMKTSQPEEMLHLAVDLTVSRPAIAQVANLVSIVKIAHQYLEIVSSAQNNVALEKITNVFPGSSPVSIDSKKMHHYYQTLVKGTDTVQVSRVQLGSESRGAAAAVVMLFLEFLHEATENKNFHRALVQLVDSPNSTFKIQEHFVELSDHLLQLLSLATQVKQQAAVSGKKPSTLSIRFGASVEEISLKSISKCVANWCLDILKSLQRLLDAPAFVSILQELIDHEHPSVRQTALQILSQRLEKMSPTKRSSNEEKVLLLDLSAHLRRVIQEAVPKKTDKGTSRSSAIGLAQSAIMCVDILASSFGKSREWATPLSDTLAEVLAFSSAILQFSKQASVMKDTLAYANELKLLAASFLSFGTLIKSVGVAALPSLPTVMSNLLGVLEAHGEEILSTGIEAMELDCTGEEDDDDDMSAGNPVLALWRTRVLLVRSTITTIGAICSEMHSFSHPYLQRILSATLSLQSVSTKYVRDGQAIVGDIDRCLSLLASCIPPRLSSPALLQAAPSILSSGHSVARRFAQLLSETYTKLDRTAILAHLGEFSEMAALVLDYRGVYGDESEASSAAEQGCTETVVVLCLKLTETEMKQLLGRLGEWRDDMDQPQSVQGGTRLRSVAFYQLLAALGSKLKAIFVPCGGPFWSHGLALLDKFSSSATALTGEAATKSKKRRKLSDSRAAEDDDGSLLKEGGKLATTILEFMRVLCSFDDCEFVDEARYSSSITSVGALISVRAAFSDDQNYLDFAEHSVSPCLVALAQCAKRDTLWKPLVHNLLMATRHSRSVVRLASLRSLHNLFVKVRFCWHLDPIDLSHPVFLLPHLTSPSLH